MKYLLMACLLCGPMLTAGTFYVDKEGARPDRDFDSGPAIWSAIEQAAKSRNSKVIFSAGVYKVTPQGRIAAVDQASGCFDLEIDEGYPLLSAPHFSTASHRWGMIMDRDLPRPKAVDADHLFAETFTLKEGRLFTVKTASYSAWRVKYAEVGDRYVQLARTGTVTLSFHKTDNILVENVTIYASPAITSACQFCTEITYKNYAIRLKPGTDRLLASNGDGIHFVNNRTGPT